MIAAAMVGTAVIGVGVCALGVAFTVGHLAGQRHGRRMAYAR